MRKLRLEEVRKPVTKKGQKPTAISHVHLYFAWLITHLLRNHSVTAFCKTMEAQIEITNLYPYSQALGKTCLLDSHQPWNQKSDFQCRWASASSFHRISSYCFTSLCLWPPQVATKALCCASETHYWQKTQGGRAEAEPWAWGKYVWKTSGVKITFYNCSVSKIAVFVLGRSGGGGHCSFAKKGKRKTRKEKILIFKNLFQPKESFESRMMTL